MPYIGAKELKASDIRRFDVTSSTSATHTLTWTPPTEQSLIVTINGIKQHEDAYSVSGTTLTLSSPLVATDKLEVIGINDIGTTITPAQNSVDLDKLATTGTPSSSTFLRGDMAWATPTDQGKVLQVVSATKTDAFSTTSSSYTAITGLSASITPSSTSSKILVICSHSVKQSVSEGMFNTRIHRDGTGIGMVSISGKSSGENRAGGNGLIVLDSPSSTSSLTYQVYTKRSTGSATISVNSDDGTSTILLMEIAG